jgi:hypothetical protein
MKTTKRAPIPTMFFTSFLLVFSLFFYVEAKGSEYPAKGLPDIITGVFLHGSPMESKINEIKSLAPTISNKCLNTVNIIVFWNDIEPSNNSFEFEQLDNIIYEIKKNGLFCILRIYMNGGTFETVAPDWFFQMAENEDIYCPNGDCTKKQPLPWGNAYQTQLRELLQNLSDFFGDEAEAIPDGYQIAAGGPYGESHLDRYDDLYISDNKAKFIKSIKYSSDLHHEFLSSLGIDLISMVNYMNGAEEYLDYQVASGYSFFQLNACLGKIEKCNYGPIQIEMVEPYINRNMGLIIEDEEGYTGFPGGDYCGAGLPPEGIKARTNRLQNLEREYGVNVSGITIHKNDLDDQDLRLLINEMHSPQAPNCPNEDSNDDGGSGESGNSEDGGGCFMSPLLLN